MDENDSLLVKLQVTESKGEERKKGKEKRKKAFRPQVQITVGVISYRKEKGPRNMGR